MRAALQQRKQESVLPGKRRSSRPTAGMLLAMCQAICVARIDRGPWMFSSIEARERVANLVELAGLNFAAVYAARAPTGP